jgi:hypothetical protein
VDVAGDCELRGEGLEGGLCGVVQQGRDCLAWLVDVARALEPDLEGLLHIFNYVGDISV